jgi:hypothetical protein
MFPTRYLRERKAERETLYIQAKLAWKAGHTERLKELAERWAAMSTPTRIKGAPGWLRQHVPKKYF